MFVKRVFPLALLSVLLLLAPAWAQTSPEAVVGTIRGFYQAIDAQDFGNAWSLLTEASKSRIVAMVAEEAKIPPEQVRPLFDNTAPEIRDGFWKSFAEGEQTKMVLNLTLEYKGEKDGFHVVTASMPVEQGGTGQTLDFLLKDEAGPKYGIAETFNF